jgi:LysM repeat protein
MRKQWTATALVMALGLAAPVLAQDDPIPPSNDPTQRQTNPDTQPDDGMTRDTPAPMPPPAETPAPADESTSADREAAVQATSGEEYVVQKGDTLSGLAERFLGSAGQWKQIADANALQNPDMISVGQKLSIPQGSNEAEPASRPLDDEANPDQAQ